MTTDLPVLSLPDAERLAERTLAAIVARQEKAADYRHYLADRERVASDLAGVRQHEPEGHTCENTDSVYWSSLEYPCDDARRYSDGLLRTAALYGVTDA